MQTLNSHVVNKIIYENQKRTGSNFLVEIITIRLDQRIFRSAAGRSIHSAALKSPSVR